MCGTEPVGMGEGDGKGRRGVRGGRTGLENAAVSGREMRAGARQPLFAGLPPPLRLLLGVLRVQVTGNKEWWGLWETGEKCSPQKESRSTYLQFIVFKVWSLDQQSYIFWIL